MEQDNKITEFDSNKEIYENSWRGTYLIIPVKVLDKRQFVKGNFKYVKFGDQLDELSDKSDLLKRRCDSNYVNKYQYKKEENSLSYTPHDGIELSDMQLFLFENGIGFITLFAFYHNSEIEYIYKLVNTGYTGAQNDVNAYEKIFDELNNKIKSSNLEILVKDESLLLNESYIFNVALVKERFKDLDTLQQVSSNVHKQIALEKKFEDHSEKDLSFSSGARDVEKETYRWGCCISTLDISFVYADDILKKENIEENPQDIKTAILQDSASDLLLTILVLIQKYTCMQLNDDIHTDVYERRGLSERQKKKVIKDLKRRALEFRAFGTLAPSQISRWNNVCVIYKGILDALGIDEALNEIEKKIALLNDAQEAQTTEEMNVFTMVITVFGIISIIASVLTIIDLVSSGVSVILIGFIVSVCILLVFVILWLFDYLKK